MKKIILLLLLLSLSYTAAVAEDPADEDGSDYQDKNISWPAWFFSKKVFLTEVCKIGDIIYQWKTPSEVLLFEGDNITMEGMLIRVK